MFQTYAATEQEQHDKISSRQPYVFELGTEILQNPHMKSVTLHQLRGKDMNIDCVHTSTYWEISSGTHLNVSPGHREQVVGLRHGAERF